MRALRFRSIFISDVHLGTRDVKAEFLLDFLRHCDSDYLYLVGDIRYGDIVYANSGDWVESCTTLVEERDGSLRLIRWADESTQISEEREAYADSDRNGRVVPAG